VFVQPGWCCEVFQDRFPVVHDDSQCDVAMMVREFVPGPDKLRHEVHGDYGWLNFLVSCMAASNAALQAVQCWMCVFCGAYTWLRCIVSNSAVTHNDCGANGDVAMAYLVS
jgi:hypothetical protein